ncbi:MAG TPA: protease complex subunit PrcB family protein [Gemmatimonadales bacterium]|nr:protease complex subunit PrcB family protein [Gemmatimonadales bacterium]
MISNRCAYSIALAALVACAGGTMRVAEDDESDPGPVALAPSPEASANDTMATPAPEPSAAPVAPPREQAAPPQGYAPYGTAGTVEIHRLGQWTRTGVSESRRLVIRDANAWAEFWSELGVGERPEVDFSRDLVIAVAAGQRPTGGHEIAVGQVAQNSGALTISVVETTPGPNCMTTASLTQPVDVVVVPSVNAKSWSFVERREVRGCR